MYYAKKGVLLNPRKGVYAKPKYNEQEMACTLLSPSYISLEYVLARAGVTFQYSSEITCISYQNRTIEVLEGAGAEAPEQDVRVVRRV